MMPNSPHDLPLVKDLVDQVYSTFDEFSAFSVALFIGQSFGKTADDLATQITDRTDDSSEKRRVRDEVKRRVRTVEQALQDVLVVT